MSLRFFLETETYFGTGFSKEIDKFLSEKGIKDVCIIVDEAVTKTSAYKDFQERVAHSSGLLDVVFSRGTEEPDYDYLDEIAENLRRQKIACLIGLGGGSTLDLTKGVSVLLTNPGKGIDYRGFDKVKNPGVPVIAIPTTAGTGSEVTVNAVFTDKKEMKKLGINGRFMNARYAILDAEWTLSCPRHVAVSSGMDAMTHTLESFICKKANTFTRMFAKEAFRLLYHNLPAIIDEPGNTQRRENILLGSYLAAISLFNSGSGIAGAFSYPIGVHYKVPHGIGGAVFLVPVVEYNVRQGYYKYDELYDLTDEPVRGLSDKEKSEMFVEKMYRLADKLGVPRALNGFGITRGSLDKIAELIKPLQPAFDQNPVEFNQLDAIQILEALTI